MSRFRRLIFILAIASTSTSALAQFNESGISAGFFDSSNEKDINFSEFHLPPLAVLFENAKTSPQILSLEKARQLAEAEVAKQKRHIFSYVTGHASYSYGIGDMWGNSQSAYSQTIYQYQGSKTSYWNIGINLAIPVEDILDLTAAVKRKRLEADQAVINKDIAYDQLKLQIATLFVKITNNLVSLKTLGEAAAALQGAGALNKEDFENGNLDIAAYAVQEMRVVDGLMEDPRYALAFSVEEVNDRVARGVPFRDAYKSVGLEIQEGSFAYHGELHHTHEGSIGNLCTDRIAAKFARVLSTFTFARVHAAVSALLA